MLFCKYFDSEEKVQHVLKVSYKSTLLFNDDQRINKHLSLFKHNPSLSTNNILHFYTNAISGFMKITGPMDGVRLFARRTFTTPKIRTFTTPKLVHLPPPKTVHLPGGQLPPPFLFLFLAHFSWLFRLTAHGGHQGWEGGGA